MKMVREMQGSGERRVAIECWWNKAQRSGDCVDVVALRNERDMK